MSITAALPSVTAHDVAVLNGSHVVATFATRNSRYTLIKREGIVVLVKDGDVNGRSPVGVGEVLKGTDAFVEDVSVSSEGPRYVLSIWDADHWPVFTSSVLVSTYVLEN